MDGGYDENTELRLAANTYRQNGTDYWPGPIASNYDTLYDNFYNKVWRMKKSNIEHHIANYNTAGYTIPNDILQWPANGNVANGEAQNLAPYADINSNDLYEPELGEYPLIRGDEALYVIYNDHRANHSATGSQKIKAEVHHMLYAYYSNGEEYNNNTVYSHYEIYNRSNLNFPHFYISNFLDIDIGFYLDDYIGTEVSKNLVYAYNGTNSDTNSNYSYSGYGINPPAYGYVLLNQDIEHSIAFGNTNDAASGNPVISSDYHNYMRAKWKHGTPIINPVDSTTSQYIYTDFPDTSDNTSWSNINYSFHGSQDYRILSTIYAQNFGPGDKICMDNAGIFAHDTSLTHLDQVTHLFNLTDQVQTFYNTQYDNCEDVSDLSIYETLDLGNQNLTVFQNQNIVTLSVEQIVNSDIQIRVMDALGRQISHNMLKQGDLSIDINLQKVTSGTYFIQCSHQTFNKSMQIVVF